MRRNTIAVALIACLAGAMAPSAARPEEEQQSPEREVRGANASAEEIEQSQKAAPVPAPDPPRESPKPAVEWRLNPRGAPGTLRGGGTRGSGTPSIRIEALAPTESFLTLEAQPVVYWYLSRATPRAIEFVLLEEGTGAPLVETALPGSHEAGIHPIRLADHGVTLRAGVRYRWLVRLVPARGESADAGDMAELMRIDDPDIRRRVHGSDPDEVPLLLARSGIWYDALHAFSTRPDSSESLGLRAELLRQGGLGAAATTEPLPE